MLPYIHWIPGRIKLQYKEINVLNNETTGSRRLTTYATYDRPHLRPQKHETRPLVTGRILAIQQIDIIGH